MLVRDEEEWMARCLNSIKDVVDEMIIVDTGSSDRTAEICQSFGAQVFRFSWNGNFADACNFALERATGDWILWLHADEELDENDRDQLRANRDKKEYHAFCLPFITYYGESSVTEKGIQTSHIRLFRNRMGYRFIHPLYERLNIEEVENDAKIGFLPVKIHRYGYLHHVIEKRKEAGSPLDAGIDRIFHPLIQSLIAKRNYIMSLHMLEKLEHIGLSNDWLSSMKGLSFMGIGLLPKAKALLASVPSSSLYYFQSLEALCIIAWVEEKFNEADMYVKQMETLAGHDRKTVTFRLLHQRFTTNHMDDTKNIDIEAVSEVFGKCVELNGKKQLEQLVSFMHKTENTVLQQKVSKLVDEFGYVPINMPCSEKTQENPLLYAAHLLSQQKYPEARKLYKQMINQQPLQDEIRCKLAATMLLELKQLLATKVALYPNLYNLYQAVTGLHSTLEYPSNPSV
ncbi:glycosyltransferase family 2 protein [Aneurinibacillus thermoaerophilus]|nr:glycosyltransferase family 2 protein [Aneurinibacillus thermoaerophilus]